MKVKRNKHHGGNASTKGLLCLWSSSSLVSKSVVVASALGLGASATIPAFAAIDNSAVATGTFSGTDYDSAPNAASVPVGASNPNLTVAKTGALLAAGDVNSDGNIDAGDTITYSYTVTNDGNVTLTDVAPVDSGPTFDGTAGTNSLSAFTLTSASDDLAPTESATFTATYVVSAVDSYNAAGVTDGVENTATSTGTLPGAGGAYNDADASTANLTIPNNPDLTIAKVAVLNDEVTGDGLAEATETITYTYTISNIGNVPLTNVNITDTHEGAVVPTASFDNEIEVTADPGGLTNLGGDTNNGIVDILGPGGVVTIRYIHTVTQPEVDNG